MDFNPKSLKRQYSQLDYQIRRLKTFMEYVPTTDLDLPQAQLLLDSLTISRSIIREWCYRYNIKF